MRRVLQYVRKRIPGNSHVCLTQSSSYLVNVWYMQTDYKSILLIRITPPSTAVPGQRILKRGYFAVLCSAQPKKHPQPCAIGLVRIKHHSDHMCLEFCHATGLPRITVSLLLSSSTRRTHQQNKNELSAKKEENIWNEANKRCWAKTFMKPLSAVLVPVGFNTTPTQIPSSATG